MISANTGSPRAGRLAVSIIMPVMDETASLRETVEIVMDECAADVREIIGVTSRFTTNEAILACEELVARWPNVVGRRQQVKPYLGGALQDAFSWANGSHVLPMASDSRCDRLARV